MATPTEDREMATFVAWAVKKYRQHAYRHTSATSGEWAAWQAATALERERCAGVCEGIARQYRADGHGHAAERAANAIRLAAPAEPEHGHARPIRSHSETARQEVGRYFTSRHAP